MASYSIACTLHLHPAPGMPLQTNKMYTSGRHLEHKKGTLGPDPGAYNVPSSMGPQAASHRASAPAWSAPKVDRLKDTFNALSQTMPAPGK